MKILNNTQQVIGFLANFTLQTSTSRDYFTISDDTPRENNAEEIDLAGKPVFSHGYNNVSSVQRKNDEQLLKREIDRKIWFKNKRNEQPNSKRKNNEPEKNDQELREVKKIKN